MKGKPLISQLVFTKLRSDIISGRLRPNDRLTELELAERFQSSQAPVREALQRLQEQGFVRIVKHTGTFVTEITTDEMKELFELRSVIEKNAVKQAMYRMRPDDREQFKRIVDRMRQAAEQNDLEELIGWDMEFHHFMIELSGKKTLLQVWNLIDGQIRRYLTITHPLFFDDLQEVHDKHAGLLHLILEGTSEQVELAFEQHVMIGWEELRSLQAKHFGNGKKG